MRFFSDFAIFLNMRSWIRNEKNGDSGVWAGFYNFKNIFEVST